MKAPHGIAAGSQRVPLKDKFPQANKWKLATMLLLRISGHILEAEQICSPGQLWKSLPDMLGSEVFVRTGTMCFYSPLIGAFPMEICCPVSNSASLLVERQTGTEAKRK